MNDDLLVKHLLGEANAAEIQEVETWLAADALNLAYYTQLREVWDKSRQLAAASTADENQAWLRFQKRVREAEQQAPAQSKRKSSGWLRMAASVALLAVLAWAAALLFQKPAPKQMLVQARQQVLSDTLPDQSVVTLNKNASISYTSRFTGSTRNVMLQGEAFFSITPNKKQPFVITVNDVQVTVLGTSFNINGKNGQTEVVVETGVVRVTRNGRSIELKAGEKLFTGAAGTLMAKEAVTDRLYNYYSTKEFICDDTPLWKLVSVVNEAYGVKIELGRKELGEERINTQFYNESLDKVLEVICKTIGVTAVKKGDRIILE